MEGSNLARSVEFIKGSSAADRGVPVCLGR